MENRFEIRSSGWLKRTLAHPFAGFIFIGVLLVALQLIAMLGGSWPKTSMLNGFATVMIYAVVGYGFTFLLGYAGLASLGTAGFVGLGAYITAYLTNHIEGIPYFVVMLAALVVSLILGVVVGYISLRIEGIFLAIVTLGLSEIFYQLFSNWLDFTNGPNGASLSKYPIFQTWLGMKRSDAQSAFYFLLVAITVLLLILTYNLGKSSVGRAMLAMKNSSSAAQAMGISLLKYRLLAFLLSTVFAGLAGVLQMSYLRYSAPQNYTVLFSLNILAAVLIGGSRNLIGTFIGTFIVFGITPIFLQDIPFFRDNPWVINVTIGLIIILVVMFYPGGFAQLAANTKAFFQKLFAERRIYKYGEDD